VRIRRALAWAVLALEIRAAAIDATGGFVFAIAGIRASSRIALRPLALAVVLMRPASSYTGGARWTRRLSA